MPDTESLSYCGREVWRHDRDRFLTVMFAPEDLREPLFALYAFNLEVAKAREVVSEPMMGRIRLQWWRDAMDGIFAGNPPRHEVAEPLSEAALHHGLPRETFDRLLDAREFDMEDEAPETMEDLIAYARDTSSTLCDLVAGVLGGGDQEATEAAGIAWSLSGLLRAVPFHARAKRLYLPRDRVKAAGLKVGDLFELRSSDALREVVAEVAAVARRALADSRRRRGSVPRRILPAVMPATLAAGDLRRLRRARHDPFDARLQRDPAGRVMRLFAAAATGRY
ncbi:MAG: phytoene/squalene synthase family protein [Acetobacterales bacterium]